MVAVRRRSRSSAKGGHGSGGARAQCSMGGTERGGRAPRTTRDVPLLAEGEGHGSWGAQAVADEHGAEREGEWRGKRRHVG